jgi:hypothetical protein
MSRVDEYGAATRRASAQARWIAVGLSLAACSGGGSATETDAARSESGTATASSSRATTEEATDVATASPANDTSGEGDASDSSAPSHCVDVIEGDLEIDDRTDLDELRTVRLVTGTVRIGQTQTLEDLNFLECLEEVGANLLIGANEGLRTLHGAARLEQVGYGDLSSGHGLFISNNPNLVSLAGLDSLRFPRIVSIYDNPSLAELSLPTVESVWSLRIGGCRQDAEDVPALGEGNNASLVEINGFQSLENVSFLEISGQASLTSIAHLGALAQAGTDFNDITIQYNPDLPVEEIEAFFTAAGKTISDERVCGNLGGAPECTCWTVGE